MRCEEVRDELIAYARSELNAARKAEVEEHLVRCEGCTRELEGARRVMALTQMADDASIADLAMDLVQTAIRRGTSDIHLEMSRGGPHVRFRIDGVIHDGPAITRKQYEPLVARIKMMAGMNISERRLPQDGRVALSHEGRDLDLRVSTCPFLHGEGVVMRVIDTSGVLLSLDRLSLYPQTRAQIETLISQPAGLILTTGPTGAGKTTLLYAMLQKLNRPDVKTVTVEDPVEFSLPGVNQMAVHRRVGITFATALRSLMRHDPDILMVGEIRDLETAQIGVQAALTGHLVLTSLHTRDAAAAVTRLLDIGIEPFVVSATLVGVIGQRLARRICPACKEPYQPSEAVLEALGFTAETRPEAFYHGAGCDQCSGTGYRGRIGLFEVLAINEELAHMIAGRASEASLRARALEQGALQPFSADARAKIADALTTAEEIDRVLLGSYPGRP